MPMNGIIRICLSALLLTVAGCAYLQGYADMAKDRGHSDAYQAALDAWTRTKTVHSQFETRASITATLKSQAFNRAYLDEYGRIYRLTPAQRQQREEAQANLRAEFTEFLVYAYTPDRDANDFDRRNSIWRVFIMDDQGHRIEPVEIRRIDPVASDMESFFPYIRKYYGNVYSLKFKPVSGMENDPGVSSGKPFKLVMTSVLASVELDW